MRWVGLALLLLPGLALANASADAVQDRQSAVMVCMMNAGAQAAQTTPERWKALEDYCGCSYDEMTAVATTTGSDASPADRGAQAARSCTQRLAGGEGVVSVDNVFARQMLLRNCVEEAEQNASLRELRPQLPADFSHEGLCNCIFDQAVARYPAADLVKLLGLQPAVEGDAALLRFEQAAGQCLEGILRRP